MNCAENPFNMGMFLQLEVSFKMGAFSDPQHTHPGIFILEFSSLSSLPGSLPPYAPSNSPLTSLRPVNLWFDL